MTDLELIKTVSNEEGLEIIDVDFEAAIETVTRFYTEEEKEEFDNLTNEEKLEIITKDDFFMIENTLFLIEQKKQIEEILKNKKKENKND